MRNKFKKKTIESSSIVLVGCSIYSSFSFSPYVRADDLLLHISRDSDPSGQHVCIHARGTFLKGVRPSCMPVGIIVTNEIKENSPKIWVTFLKVKEIIQF